MIQKFKKKAGVCCLTALLACVLCAAPVFAMENNGEAGLTPDPPDIVEPIDPPSEPDPPSNPAEPDPPPVSSSQFPAVSDPEVSSPSEPNPPVSSGGTPSSSITSRPHTTSSRVVYSDPDPRESYVEYIPPNRGNTNQNNHTTSAQNPIAVAPTEKNTELLSSQNWDELLHTSSASGSLSSPASSLPPINGIFSQKEDANKVSNILIIGIVLLICGAAGVAFFIYSQFIYKRRKAKAADDDDDDSHDHPFPPSRSSKSETSPLPYVPTERDISSFSDPQMKPSNPLKNPAPPTRPAPPKRNRVEIEDIDWDQFFKDNK